MWIKPLIWALAVLLTAGLPATIKAQQSTQQSVESSPARAAQASGGSQKKKKPLFPEDVAGLEEMAGGALEEGNNLRFLQANILLRQKQPQNPDHIVGMAIAYALLEKKNSAYEYIYKLQKMGLSYDFDNVEQMEFLRDTEVYDYLNDLLKRQGQPMGKAETAFTLGEDVVQPVAMSWDSSRDRFLVGTAVDGLILAVDENGNSEEILRATAQNGLWSITGLKVDAARNRLWVSTAALPIFSNFTPTEFGQSAVAEFELDSLDLVERYLAPIDGMRHEFGPIEVTGSGDVYVADRLGPMVFRKATDESALIRFSTHPDMTGFRDMTLGPGGFFLYLTDREKGIIIIDPQEQKAAMLDVPENLNLWGLEGLFSWGESLVVVQSGTNPQRILRLELNAEFGGVTEVQPLAVAQKEFDWPSFGAVKDDELFFFANSNIIDLKAAARPVLVMRTEIDPEDQIVAADLQKFKEEQAQRQQEKAEAN